MKTKKKIFCTLNECFRMTAEELNEYNKLPSNMPETVLTSKQKQLVSDLYYKYISGKVTKGWGIELFEIEKKEKWPSGDRMKMHEAQRIILNNLVYHNGKPELSAEQAANMFHSSLTNRESYTILLQKIYTLKPAKR